MTRFKRMIDRFWNSILGPCHKTCELCGQVDLMEEFERGIRTNNIRHSFVCRRCYIKLLKSAISYMENDNIITIESIGTRKVEFLKRHYKPAKEIVLGPKCYETLNNQKSTKEVIVSIGKSEEIFGLKIIEDKNIVGWYLK